MILDACFTTKGGCCSIALEDFEVLPGCRVDVKLAARIICGAAEAACFPEGSFVVYL